MRRRIAALSLMVCGGMLAAGHVAAQKKPPQPAPPAPLVVVDSTGKTAGRLADSFLAHPTGLRHSLVVVNVNGAFAMASMAFNIDQSTGAVARGLFWSQSLQPSIYYPTSDCSGPPFVTDVQPLGANAGLRKAVIDIDPSTRHRVMYVGANVDAALAIAFSKRDFRCGDPASCAQDVGTCTMHGSFVPAVPVEASIDLDATYPPPLTIR